MIKFVANFLFAFMFAFIGVLLALSLFAAFTLGIGWLSLIIGIQFGFEWPLVMLVFIGLAISIIAGISFAMNESVKD